MTSDVALGVWLVGLIVWWIIRFPHRRRARRTQTIVDERSVAERALLTLTIVGLAVLPAIHAVTVWLDFATYPFKPTVGWLGAFAMCGFLWLFYVSHKHLARNWSVSLEIRDGHELVKTGVYRYIRHPMYSSFWLWGLAQALLIPNWVAGLAGIASVALLYFSRINKEESMMHNQFGEAYSQYCKETWRLFPKLI